MCLMKDFHDTAIDKKDIFCATFFFKESRMMIFLIVVFTVLHCDTELLSTDEINDL